MKFLTAAALALLAAGPALAATPAPLMLDFEDAPSFDSVADHYAAQGVSFGADALGLANDEAGTYFSHAPSPLGVMFTTGSDATLNVADGFVNGFAFHYASAAAAPASVSVWSALNGTGTLLARFDLAANAQNGCSDSAFCHFDRLSASFSGVAHSVTFGDAVSNVVAFDNLQVGAVPEPTTVLMMAFGLAGLALGARRRG